MKNSSTCKFSELIAEVGMDPIFIFIEDPELPLSEIRAIEERFPEDEGSQILSDLANNRKIFIRFAGTPNEEVPEFPMLNAGYNPWDDGQQVEYFITKERNVILKKVNYELEN